MDAQSEENTGSGEDVVSVISEESGNTQEPVSEPTSGTSPLLFLALIGGVLLISGLFLDYIVINASVEGIVEDQVSGTGWAARADYWYVYAILIIGVISVFLSIANQPLICAVVGAIGIVLVILLYKEIYDSILPHFEAYFKALEEQLGVQIERTYSMGVGMLLSLAGGALIIFGGLGSYVKNRKSKAEPVE